MGRPISTDDPIVEPKIGQHRLRKSGPADANTINQSGYYAKKLSLRTVDDLKGCTVAYRRAMEWLDDTVAALGGEEHLSPQKIRLLQHAAFCSAMAEHMQVLSLSGTEIHHGSYNSLIQTFHSLLKSVGLERHKVDVTPRLEEYLRSREDAADDRD